LPTLDSWDERRIYLQTLEQWDFDGRIGVSAGDEGFNGKIFWHQNGLAYRARLSGPLGLGTIFVNGDQREVTLTDSDGVVTELKDAEADLRARYGWTIPVASLRYWALGVPDPSTDAETTLEGGRLVELSQSGWSVSILDYAERGGLLMPRRLTAVSDDIRVRLVIGGWEFP